MPANDMKSLTLHAHGCLRVSLGGCLSSLLSLPCTASTDLHNVTFCNIYLHFVCFNGHLTTIVQLIEINLLMAETFLISSFINFCIKCIGLEIYVCLVFTEVDLAFS